MRNLVLTLSFILCSVLSFASSYVTAKPKSGDGTYALLKRYNLQLSDCVLNKFYTLNEIDKSTALKLTVAYKLPIAIKEFNGTSIRSSINISNYDVAKSIQDYNEKLVNRGLKSKDFRKDKVLWVPYHLLQCQNELAMSSPETLDINSSTIQAGKDIYPIFGKDYAHVPKTGKTMEGHVYYLVAGHGGPDPGAVGSKDGNQLCEDEYAYDVTLRLGRKLIANGAKVHIIIRDPNDGIRDSYILEADQDETCGTKRIPLNQLNRLSQRASLINKLYKENRAKGYKVQKVVVIHVDSRASKQGVDVFFYHHPNSSRGKQLATDMYNTFKEKYEEAQPGRGYGGTVKSRNLYMLTHTDPITLYVELGNIQSTKDHKRLLNPKNREVLAKWLYEGLVKNK